MAADRTDTASAISRYVADGDIVFLGGFGHAVPFAAAHEVIRQHRRRLTVCRSGADIAVDQLIAAGCVSKVVFGYLGNPVLGLAHAFSRAVRDRTLEVEEWTNWAMVLRFHAAALGVPFLPSRILAEGDIADTSCDPRAIVCPFTGETLQAIPALRPDVALVHAQRATVAGDVQLWGISGDTIEGALASDRIVVTVEQIVDDATVTATPERTVLPSYRVTAICEEPFGAHPSYVDGYYSRDDQAFRDYNRVSRDQQSLDAYLQQWVHDCGDRQSYRRKWHDLVGQIDEPASV